MKKILAIILALMPIGMAAQEEWSQEEFIRRYSNLAGRVGASGLGVETLLDRWQAAYPDDDQQYLARFSMFFDRCRTSRVEAMPVDRYLGAEPIIPMTDSLGNKANWFEVFDYDDELFGEAKLAIDKAIELQPQRIDYRFYKADALLAYEKGSPDMTLQNLRSLIDYNCRQHPAWVHPDLDHMDEERFKAFMQDYCAALFRLGTPGGTNAFLSLSEHLLQYYKGDVLFMNNIGSYYISQKDFKKAQKQIDEVLKKEPGNMTALRNGLLLGRFKKDVKLEKKYLALMAAHGETELDRNSAAVRLEAYNNKK